MGRAISRPLAVAALGWAVVVALTGGFVVRLAGVRLSSHRIVPPFACALILLFASRRNREWVAGLTARLALPRAHAVIASTATLGALLVGVLFGAFTAAGDAFGYLTESALWREGRLFLPPGPALAFHWPMAVWTFAPVAYRPAPDDAAIVPIYAAGLPLLMAAMRTAVGSMGPFLVVPLCGALCVYLTYRFGRLCYGRTVGAVAAVLLLASPVFLFQLVQPMSDVPATAAWLLSVVALCEGGALGVLGSGLAASLAILIRPNLAPLAVPLAVYAVCFPAPSMAARLRRVALFAAGVLPLCLLAAWINTALYGSPLSSGYGRAADIYSLSNFLTNLARYPRWLLDTHTAFIFLAFGAPFVRGRLAVSWLALALVATLFACYAFYLPFEHWTFLRFLLPGIALMLVLAAHAVTALADHAGRLRAPVIISATVLVALLSVQAAVRGDAFALKTIMREHFEDVGRALLSRTEKNAIFISLVHTGSVHYYARRESIRFDLLRPGDLDLAIGELTRAGYVPYVLLRRDELPQFRSRFSGHSAAGALDWAPVALDKDADVLLFDPRRRR